MKCEYCGKRDGAYNPTIKAHICEPCWFQLGRADRAWNQRCEEDQDFEDRISEGA